MGSSSSYWSFTENVRDEIESISALAKDAYSNLESSDDPGEVAAELKAIQGYLEHAAQQIAAAFPTLKKAGSALSEIPAFKGKK